MKRYLFKTSLSAFLIGLSLYSNLAVAGERVHRYTVTVDDLLTTIKVEACFEGRPEFALVAESLDAALALQSAEIKSTGKKVTPSGKISLHDLGENDCILYTAAVAYPIMAHDKRSMTIKRVGRDLITAEGIWLWKPDNQPINDRVLITFDLPSNITISAPWEIVEDKSEHTYLLGNTPYDWPAFVIFGFFPEQHLLVGRSKIRLAILESKRKIKFKESISQGVLSAAEIVSSITGRFPVDDLQMVVEPGAYGPNAIPIGYVSRGGKPAVHVHINERKHDIFAQDTTLLHEFAHLLLPKINDGDSWLTEGLATYYEYLLAARSGYKSIRETVTFFDKNFEVARLTLPDEPLSGLSEKRSIRFGREKIYWGGAAIFFVADVKLRVDSKDLFSLDDVVSEFNACCAKRKSTWSGEEVMHEFDRISGNKFFSQLYKSYIVGNIFPPVENAFNNLGFEVSGFGQNSGVDRNSKLKLSIFK